MDRHEFDAAIQKCQDENDGWLIGGKCPRCWVHLDGVLMHQVAKANPGTGEVVVVRQPLQAVNDEIVTDTIRGRSIVVTPYSQKP